MATSESETGLAIQQALDSGGYLPVLVATGDAALRLLEVDVFRLILLDTDLPTQGGLQFAKTLRLWEQKRGRGRAAVVALAAQSPTGSRESCLRAGMDDYLTKSVDQETLLASALLWLADTPTVLVVSACVDTRSSIAGSLRASGRYRTVGAATAEEGIALAGSRPIDAVVVDDGLPRLLESDVAVGLRGSEATAMVPILALTERADDEARRRCLDAGCSAVVGKPVASAQLVAQLSALVSSTGCPEPHPDPVVLQLASDIRELVPNFLRNRHKDLKRLDEFLSAGNFTELVRMGHNMKGSGTSYGMPEISDIGRRLEAASQLGDVNEILLLDAELRQYLERVQLP